jgi:hypothetical protein
VGGDQISAGLTSYQAVPALSTAGQATFTASVASDENSISWTLNYSQLQGVPTQAHIHLGQPGINGGIAVFLCSNLGNGPVGTLACPTSPGQVSGTIHAADVAGPSAQGIAVGELGELIDALDAGATYVDVHTDAFTSGEVRAQLKPPPGPQGPQGAQGVQGATGPAGTAGESGDNAKVKCKVVAPKKVKCKVKLRKPASAQAVQRILED